MSVSNDQTNITCSDYMNDPANNKEMLILIGGVVHRKGCPCLLKLQMETIWEVFCEHCDNNEWTSTTDLSEIHSKSFTKTYLQTTIQDILDNHYSGGGYKKVEVVEKKLRVTIKKDTTNALI